MIDIFLIQIISDPNFPDNPQKAILNGFILAEKVFLHEAMADKGNYY